MCIVLLTAIGQLPPPSLLSQVPLIGVELPPSLTTINPTQTSTSVPSAISSLVHIGLTFPPVPGKLVKRIEQGCFIEMGELLPECFGYQNLDDDSPSVKPKCHTVTDIVSALLYIWPSYPSKTSLEC